MDTTIERRISQLCDLAARERDGVKLKNVIDELLECIESRQRQREQKTNQISLSEARQNDGSH